jgi:uncharacterized protein
MRDQLAPSSVVHNELKNRFEIEIGGQLAVAEYREEGDRMVFTYTQVPAQFRGHGIAEKLVLAGFEVARKRNLRIVALCSYVAHVLQKHPEFRELSDRRKL